MRIRSIKPEFWSSEKLGRLSRDARLVFIGLWSLADDSGRFRADPRYVAGQLFAYDDDGLDEASRALASLRDAGLVVLYEANGSHYGAVLGWSEHQKIDRPTLSKFPEPPGITLASPREPSTSPRESSLLEQGAGSREQGEEQGAGRPASVRPMSLSRIEAPDTPPEGWSADDFWRWYQWERVDGVEGLPQEKPLHPRKLSEWWAVARGQCSVGQLQAAAHRYGSDPYWCRQTPPVPFAGFASQWQRFVREEVRDVG